MATKVCDIYTNQVGNSYCPQVHVEIWQTSTDNAYVYYDWYMYYDAYGYAAYTNGNARSVTLKVGGDTYTGSININGVTGTKLISSGSNFLYKQHDNRWVSCSVTFGIDVTWGSSYASSTSGSSGFTIGPKTSYTVQYNANGGSGAPSNQTKWYAETLTLSSTKPTRTGYSFQGWGTSASDTSVDYAAGASYTANSASTLYAIWKANTYTVSYNANGGSGAPSSQTKTHGVDLTLSTTKPTRTNYNFLGWSTSSTASSAQYASGGKYTTNAAVTLYAVWELAYWKPKITNLKTFRCTSSGTADDFNTYTKVTFSWELCQLTGTNNVKTVTVGYKLPTATSYTNTTVTASGTSGSVSQVIGGSLDVNNSYDIQVTITDDKSGSTTLTTSIGSSAFAIDILKEGKGIAFGKAATAAGYVDSAWPFRVNGRLLSFEDSSSQLKTKNSRTSGANLDSVITPGTYACNDATAAGLSNCPIDYGFTMDVSYSYGTTDFITQKIFVPYYETEYSRRYTVSSKVWSAWKSDFAHDTGWVALNSQVSYRRVGKVVFVRGECNGAVQLVSGSYTTVATLPTGFRPSISIQVGWDAIGGSVWTKSGYIGTDGQVMLYQKEGAVKDYWRFSVAFPVDTSV